MWLKSIARSGVSKELSRRCINVGVSVFWVAKPFKIGIDYEFLLGHIQIVWVNKNAGRNLILDRLVIIKSLTHSDGFLFNWFSIFAVAIITLRCLIWLKNIEVVWLSFSRCNSAIINTSPLFLLFASFLAYSIAFSKCTLVSVTSIFSGLFEILLRINSLMHIRVHNTIKSFKLHPPLNSFSLPIFFGV